MAEAGGIGLPENFDAAVAWLSAGHLVVFPTETFYAIGADPSRPDALDRIVRLKGRDANKPIALIAADNASAFALAREIPDDARRLAEIFWPGPLTLVLPARAGINPLLVGIGGGVGVRISPHPVASALARASHGLITATSANRSGEPPARTIMQARQALGAHIAAYLDGGVLGSDAASTVVEVSKTGSLRILREGVIGQGAIADALKRRQ
jgi:L-threonylcarbamoyladenylate synthase